MSNAFYNKKKEKKDMDLPEKVPINYVVASTPSDIVQKVHDDDDKKTPFKEEKKLLEEITIRDSDNIKELEAKLAKLDAFIKDSLQQPTAKQDDLQQQLNQLRIEILGLEEQKRITIPTYEQFLQYVKSKQASSSVCNFLYKRTEKHKKPDRATIMKVLEVIREMNSE